MNMTARPSVETDLDPEEWGLSMTQDPAAVGKKFYAIDSAELRDLYVVLVSNCDISSGNGDLFAIGPEFSIAAAEPDAAQMEFLRAAERAAEEFFTDNLDEVRRALMAGES
jgi:hypothetical protein